MVVIPKWDSSKKSCSILVGNNDVTAEEISYRALAGVLLE